MEETFKIKALFDNIAEKYDFLNHLLSFFQDFYWRHVMAEELYPLQNNGLICDLATGTGDSALVILKKGFHVIGVDISLEMLSRTGKKIGKKRFSPLCASAYTLPFKDDTFDALTCAFGIRNMHATDMALSEIYRIIKKGGKAIFLEFSMPEGFFLHLYRFYLCKIMPNIARFFSNKEAYDYLWSSIETFPKPKKFEELLFNAGFKAVIQKSMSFKCVYLHKAYKI